MICTTCGREKPSQKGYTCSNCRRRRDAGIPLDEPVRRYSPYGMTAGQRLRLIMADVAPTESGCLEWPEGVADTGYGTIHDVGRKRRSAHRVAYEEAFGQIPEGLYVLHACDNRKCVNPDHLFLGTCRDNSIDMRKKARHPIYHFTPEQVIEIRRRLQRGEKGVDIASSFGVSKSTISSIARGRTYTWVQGGAA